MTDQELLALKPKPTAGTLCRKETFGALLAGGNLPILNINDDSVRIWELCDGSRTVTAIEALLFDEYETEGLRERLLTFLRFCLQSGFMTTTEE